MKPSERIAKLEQNNTSLFMSNHRLSSEFKSLKFDLVKLEHENEQLKKEQEEFQAELKKEIDRIRGLSGFNRWINAVKLIFSLISTIEKGFKK